MTPFLNAMVVIIALSWALIFKNIANELRRMLERERPEEPRPARNRSMAHDRKVLKGKH